MEPVDGNPFLRSSARRRLGGDAPAAQEAPDAPTGAGRSLPRARLRLVARESADDRSDAPGPAPLPNGRTCACSHARTAHQHHRRGTDCALCDCPRFRWRLLRLRGR